MPPSPIDNHPRLTRHIVIWSKWTSEALSINPALTIVTRKLRSLRKFDTGQSSPREIKVDENENIQEPLPQNGCNVELTRLIMPDDEQWFTFGFEAFGTLSDVENSCNASRRQWPTVGLRG